MKAMIPCVAVTTIWLACGCNQTTDPTTQAQQRSGAEPDALAGVSATEDVSSTERVQLALNWFPEAEHGGYYAALVHGYYADEGFDVEIIPGGPGAPVIQEVVVGRVGFGVVNADQILLGRAEARDASWFTRNQASTGWTS